MRRPRRGRRPLAPATEGAAVCGGPVRARRLPRPRAKLPILPSRLGWRWGRRASLPTCREAGPKGGLGGAAPEGGARPPRPAHARSASGRACAGKPARTKAASPRKGNQKLRPRAGRARRAKKPDWPHGPIGLATKLADGVRPAGRPRRRSLGQEKKAGGGSLGSEEDGWGALTQAWLPPALGEIEESGPSSWWRIQGRTVGRTEAVMGRATVSSFRVKLHVKMSGLEDDVKLLSDLGRDLGADESLLLLSQAPNPKVQS